MSKHRAAGIAAVAEKLAYLRPHISISADGHVLHLRKGEFAKPAAPGRFAVIALATDGESVIGVAEEEGALNLCASAIADLHPPLIAPPVLVDFELGTVTEVHVV